MKHIEIDPETLAAIRARVMESLEHLAVYSAKQHNETPKGDDSVRFLSGMKSGVEVAADAAARAFDSIAKVGLVVEEGER